MKDLYENVFGLIACHVDVNGDYELFIEVERRINELTNAELIQLIESACNLNNGELKNDRNR